MNNKEEWRAIKGYEGYYEVSNKGRIKSLDRVVSHPLGERKIKGRIMKQSYQVAGYLKVKLSRDGIDKTYLIHTLVAVAFLNHTPDGHTLVVNHIDGVKTNNTPSNLEITTHRDNISNKFRKDRDYLASNYPGVSKALKGKPWVSRIRDGSKVIYLGTFDTEKQASKAYQKELSRISIKSEEV